MVKRSYTVAAWTEYVWDLCSIRDCLGLLKHYDAAHPVFVALDKVSPRMSEADEAFVRTVIAEWAQASMARDESNLIGTISEGRVR